MTTAILLAPILYDINWFLVIPGAALFILLWAGLTVSFTEAAEKRRAWNLWAAGLIDDEELKRRIGE
jgi:hypothetical protein